MPSLPILLLLLVHRPALHLHHQLKLTFPLQRIRILAITRMNIDTTAHPQSTTSSNHPPRQIKKTLMFHHSAKHFFLIPYKRILIPLGHHPLQFPLLFPHPRQNHLLPSHGFTLFHTVGSLELLLLKPEITHLSPSFKVSLP